MQRPNSMTPMYPMPQMNPVQFLPNPTQPLYPMLPPAPPPSSVFWETTHVQDRLSELGSSISLAKAMQKELEALIRIKDDKGSVEGDDDENDHASASRLSSFLDSNNISLESEESLSLRAVSAMISKLGAQIAPFTVVPDDASPWEEKSAAVRLGNKIQKSKRNKLWRKRKRKRIAETLAKERERFDQADQEADEWRAREIAKDIAKRKVEKMKEIAKLKAKEERRKLESELELVLIVEKLQELRTMRIQKLKKQGHFFPEEDDKFLERVRAAVEEEERQVMAAADTSAAKEAIATAEGSRKSALIHVSDAKVVSNNKEGSENNQVQSIEGQNKLNPGAATAIESRIQESVGQSYGGAYGSEASLPMEFYHYYHGSTTDMGTLIEVRRTWDQYIRMGGSRIPGHSVQPPPPSDEIWASYLVQPKG